jgi:hypothetical protein
LNREVRSRDGTSSSRALRPSRDASRGGGGGKGGGATRTATRTTIHAETGEDGARSTDRSIVPRGKAVPTS